MNTMNNTTPRILVATIALATLCATLSIGAAKSAATAKGACYPLATCPVSGKPLDKDSVAFVIEDSTNPLNDGREIRFCCPKCVASFTAEPQKFLPAIDAAIIEQQRPFYPLIKCIVMTEDDLPLPGSEDAGKLRELVVLNDLVRVCCPGCIKKIKKDPAKFVAIIDAAAIAAQKKNYALTTCPVSGEALEPDATEVVIGERLVRLCCGGCADKAKQNPGAIYAKLDAGTTKSAPTAPAKPAAPATTAK
ncbi:MAG: hypothetical protein EXS17_08410 [Phycisphaerales bacterium]|nr:hypothetical protein [Phycisphaerales bacterium]